MANAPQSDPIPETRSDSDRREVVIFGNPFSGARANRQRVDALAASGVARGLSIRIVWDRDERNALLGDSAWLARCRCLVAAGGDGTFADIVNQSSASAPLAILPLGNENLLARRWGFNIASDRLADAILAGRIRHVDAGRVNGHMFMAMVTAGIDADVVRRVAAWRQVGSRLRRVRRASYLRPIFASLCDYRFPTVTLTADGQPIQGALAMVFNTPTYASGLSFLPDAREDDGLLDWIVFERPGVGRALVYLASVAMGRHLTRGDVRHGRASHITMTAEGSVPIQVDGDPFRATSGEISVVPRALQLIDVRQPSPGM